MGAIVAPQPFRLSEMRQFLQLLCAALLGLMVFVDFERHQHPFAAAAAQGGVLAIGGDAEEHTSRGAPGAWTGPAVFAGSVQRNAPSASSEPTAPDAAAPSQSGSSSDSGASGDSDAHGHPPPVIGSSSAAAPSPANASGNKSALDKFRDYVFGVGPPADAKRTELRRQQDLAREALSRGQIQPLDVIVRSVENSVPGELLSVRLEKNAAGTWTYRLVILSDSGRYHDVVVDAWRNVILKFK
ncbi:MAG: PepSY domain-containing protein [Xanthobacteraceae bacterium]